MADGLFWLIVGLLIGHQVGWARAHRMVATECIRLGRFFVGKQTFQCVSVEPAFGGEVEGKGR